MEQWDSSKSSCIRLKAIFSKQPRNVITLDFWWRWQLELYNAQSSSQIITTNKPSPSFSASAMASISWSRPRAFGLGPALVLLTWPRKCAFQRKIILVVSISWWYHCKIHYKDVVKHSNVGQKFIYVLLALSPCVLSQKHLHMVGLDLGCGLVVLTSAWVLASFNITAFLRAGRPSCCTTNRVRALKVGWATGTTKTLTNSTSISTQRSYYNKPFVKKITNSINPIISILNIKDST